MKSWKDQNPSEWAAQLSNFQQKDLGTIVSKSSYVLQFEVILLS